MAENHQSMKMPNEELLQAHAELWNLTFSYLKSMALDCAIKLGIPTAIHCCGGATSLPDLLAALPVPESKKSYLPRLMRFLAASGIFTVDVPAAGECANVGATGTYRLTPLSRLLVDGDDGQRTNLSPFVLSQTNKYHVTAAMHLSDWFTSDQGSASAEMPYRMAHGTDPWTIMARDPKINQVFNAGMAADTQFVKILTQCKKVIPKPGGKVIIVDIVVGSPNKSMFEAQVLGDLLMMVMTSGKERDEHEWGKIFMDAGFSHYKTRPIMGCMAITELYP